MSEIRANTISDAAGTGPATLTGQSAAKAWLSYIQSTNTVNNSFNVSSVTDILTGNFSVSFSSSMSSGNYSPLITCGSGSALPSNARINGTSVDIPTSSNCKFRSYEIYSGDTDRDTLNGVSISGDLA